MKNKILVVDDESDLQELIVGRFRKQIKEDRYEFFFAENGKQALEIMATNSDIAMVLTDINMPIMDGLSLLEKLNDAYPLVKVVMVSAYGDMYNIRNAMNRRAFDFICKPVNFTDLETTMEKTIDYVSHIRDSIEILKKKNNLEGFDESVLRFLGQIEYRNQ